MDLALLAKAYGLKYLEIKNLTDVEKIQNSLADKYPYLIDFKILLDSKCLNRYDDFKKVVDDLSAE